MMPWSERSPEEQALLNPAFCAVLLWHSAVGHASVAGTDLSFEEAFLVLPCVLHQDTRENLPRDTRTSIPVWLAENPLAQQGIARRARSLALYTRQAILFGGRHGLFHLVAGRLRADETSRAAVTRSLRTTSDEVRMCAKKAEFVGKWFAAAGNAQTVLAVMGVQP
jgi:hypothetical protein